MGISNPAEQWSVVHNPSAATQATVSKAAPGSDYKHVVTGIAASIAAAGTAQAAPIHVHLRDGASGAGTIIWSAVFTAPVNTCAGIVATDLYIPCTAGTAATLEFEGAGAAATVESVSMQGITVDK